MNTDSQQSFPQDIKLVSPHPSGGGRTVIETRDLTTAYTEESLTLERDAEKIREIGVSAVELVTNSGILRSTLTSLRTMYALKRSFEVQLRSQFGSQRLEGLNDPLKLAVEAAVANFGVMINILLEKCIKLPENAHKIALKLSASGVYKVDSSGLIFAPKIMATMTDDGVERQKNIMELEIARIRFTHGGEAIDTIVKETGFDHEEIFSKGPMKEGIVRHHNPLSQMEA